jgi:hypothetical protein
MNRTRLKICFVAILFSAACIGLKVDAGSITVPDFSFELWTNPVTGFGLADGATTAGPDVGSFWRAAGNGGVNLVNPLDAQFPGTTGSPGTLPATGDGTNYFFIGLGHDGFGWQTVATVQSNTIYTLTVAVGNTLSADGGHGSINLLSGTFPGGTALGSAPVDSTVITPGSFADTTLVLTNGQHGGKPLTILLQGTGLSGTELIYDNVRLDATPAPAAATALVPAASPSTNVYVGTMVTLTEDPAGQTPFTYQWQTDGGTGGATFTNVPSANSASLVVDTSGFSGTPIEYQVIVSNALGFSTSAPVILTAIQGGPVLVADTLPSSGSDVVGGQITFSAVFDGTRPITYQWEFQDTNGSPAVDISGATNSSLTLSNLQLSDFGVYFLIASNNLGTAQSTPTVFAVNPVPDATNNIVIATANQTGLGGTTTFSPSWVITTNGDLLAGTLPSTVGPGDFSDPQEHIAGTPVVLTDGKLGTFYPAGVTSPDVITGGTAGSGAGQYVIYTLPASATGWDVTNVVTYGGWADAGRDEQRYTLFYSTIAAPSNFTSFADVAFNPSNPSGVQSATRVTISPSGASALVKNVAALKFDFSPLANSAENGFVGYSEFQVYGVHSVPAPVLASDTEPGSASDVVGGQITFTATITGATSYQWLDIANGMTNTIVGQTNQTLTLSNLQLTDSGSYMLLATNSSGSTHSSASPLVVNSPGNAFVSGAATVTASGANQTGRGSTYTPNWVIATNGDLVLGTFPSGIGSGVFNQEGSGGIAVLTDGRFGSVGSGINSSLATVGQNGGRSLTYTLTGPVSGFDITNITTYGGWSDGGRDQQAYTVSYSTVLAPTVFNAIATVSFNPSLPGSVPSSDRLMLSSTSGPIATNVAKILFDFTNPGIENGWGGLAEIGVFGTASAAIPLAPYLVSDILPGSGSDVVGSQVTFKVTFNGTAPITYQWQKISGGVTNSISGATSTTLTLTNLQLSDSAFYQLQASNAQGVSFSSSNAFTVNPVPAPNGNGVIASPANQTGSGAFTPTWSVAAGSLIAGTLPSSTGVGGSFTADPGEGGLPVLTDGALNLFGGSVAGLATCGSGAGGHSITYTLSGSASGYNLSGIVSYAGWADAGRDQQAYTASYSTVASPSTFTTIGVANYNPTGISGPSADRVTFSSATASPIATNVASVKFNFTSPAGENGYSGYAEFQIFGSAAVVPRPTITSVSAVGGNLILIGSGGSAGGSYSVITSTNAGAPLSTWTTNTSGTFSGSGGFSNSIPISISERERFFLLKSP